MKPIDLRTDALTPPTEAMWEAMRRAELGWAMRGEDRSVCALEALGAQMLGKEAGLFLPSCSMANLAALLALGRPGSQIILEATSHVATSEEWAAAEGQPGPLCALLGITPRLLGSARGVMPAEAVEAAILEGEAAGRPASLVALENSHNNAGGAAVTAAALAAVAQVARRHGAAVHLDGARLFNAAVALGAPAAELAASADTVAISLNKGLSAPLGALLCGSHVAISAARAAAGHLGAGSIHKAGIFAAAGIVALSTMVERLAEDHRRAARLARRLADVAGLRVEPAQTNIVLAEITAPGLSSEALVEQLAAAGVLALARAGRRVRFVLHRLIDDEDVIFAAQAIAQVMHSISSTEGT